MSKNKIREEIHDDGSYVVKKSRKGTVFALILCWLIAFCIWAVAATIYDGEPETDNGAKQASVLCSDTALTL